MLLKGQKMTNLDFDAIIIALIVIVCGGGMAFVVIKSFIDAHKQRIEYEKESEQPYFEPQLFEYKATVVEKYCQVENFGIKMPEHRNAFYITFQTYDGRILKYGVLEDDYLQIEENQSGTLAVVNNQFYGFCPDEQK